MKQITSIDELINALNEQHQEANQNKHGTKRKQIDMICIKVNPPIVASYSERQQLENVKGLIIPKIKLIYS